MNKALTYIFYGLEIIFIIPVSPFILLSMVFADLADYFDNKGFEQLNKDK